MRHSQFVLIFLLFLYSSDIKGQIQSANDGDWSNTATWVGAVVPGAGDNVEILTTHDITLTTDASCIDLELQGNATLNISGNYT
ncbi:MAG: hypothetical protein IH946_08840, partial [Bacteroidetes bacterium]|nr:hypothetical protein [Bacteroidota bacterium]